MKTLKALAARSPYTTLYLGLATVLCFASMLLPTPDVAAGSAEFKDSAAAMLDVVKSLTTLISALTTALCAGAAAGAVKGKDWSATWSRIEGGLVIVVLLCGAVSYYGMYLSWIAVLEMVGAGAFGLDSPRLSTAIAVQYYAVLVGYLILGLVFCRLMEGRRLESPPKSG